MIEYHFDRGNAILHLKPVSALEKGDFDALAREVDPYIAGTGGLAGLIIETPSFPGWDSPGALTAHLRFVRDHHKHIRKLALVTGSALGAVAGNLASHFLSAEVKPFPASDIQGAKEWILGNAPMAKRSSDL